MTVQEWREQNPDTSYTMVFAADAHSFGPKGGSVYGSREVTGRMQVISVEMQRICRRPSGFPGSMRRGPGRCGKGAKRNVCV